MEKKKYWVVKLGNLFYAGGYPSSINKTEIMTFRFVRYEEAASKFRYEDVAQGLAEQIGGEAREKEATPDDYDTLDDIEEFHHKKMVLSHRAIILPV